jgi:putative transposase
LLTTWKYRIKDSSRAGRELSKMARAVNFAWNFAKQTQLMAYSRKSGRLIVDKQTGKTIGIPNILTAFELSNLAAGSSKELGLHSQTIQAVMEEWSRRRKQVGKLPRWRGRKSLGWIPWKSSGFKIQADAFQYAGKKFRFWNSRELPLDAKIKTGSFSQDKRGRWYLNITFESNSIALVAGTKEIGIDIGIKTLAALSDGTKIESPKLRAKFLEKIKRLEKTRKFSRRKAAKSKKYLKLPKQKQERNLHAKIANCRADYLHKESTKLIQKYKLIVVGDVPCKLMNKSKNLSGVSYDSGIGMFKTMLNFKAKRAGSTYLEVSERNSSQTCSKCGWKHPQEKRIGLNVREWTCESCGSRHDRDLNAATNILRMGHHALTQCA